MFMYPNKNIYSICIYAEAEVIPGRFKSQTGHFTGGYYRMASTNITIYYNLLILGTDRQFRRIEILDWRYTDAGPTRYTQLKLEVIAHPDEKNFR